MIFILSRTEIVYMVSIINEDIINWWKWRY